MFQTFKLLIYFFLGFLYLKEVQTDSMQNRYTLTVQVDGVIVNKGTLYIAVYTSKENFLNEAFRKTKVDLQDFNNEFTFKNLPKGEYAVTIYQDLNQNKKLDKFLSIPLEPYGISNNVNGFPNFMNSKILLTQNKTIIIKIKN